MYNNKSIKKVHDTNADIAFQNGIYSPYWRKFKPEYPYQGERVVVQSNYVHALTEEIESLCTCFYECTRAAGLGEIALRTRLLEMIGYILSPDTGARVIFLLQGVPNSGKILIAQLLISYFKKENVCAANIHTLGRISAEDLEGQALCLVPDLPDEPLSDAVVQNLKRLVGIDARPGEIPRCKTRFVLMTEHPFLMESKDDAFLNQIVVVPFREPMSEPEQREETMQAILTKERDAIATLAVQAYSDLVSSGYAFSGEYLVNSLDFGALENIQWCQNPREDIYEFTQMHIKRMPDYCILVSEAREVFMAKYGYLCYETFAIWFQHYTDICFEGLRGDCSFPPDTEIFDCIMGITSKES